jgi:hypothetical protein
MVDSRAMPDNERPARSSRLFALVRPELMKWARETAGMGLDEAARRISVKRDRLEGWAAPTDGPTTPQGGTCLQAATRRVLHVAATGRAACAARLPPVPRRGGAHRHADVDVRHAARPPPAACGAGADGGAGAAASPVHAARHAGQRPRGVGEPCSTVPGGGGRTAEGVAHRQRCTRRLDHRRRSAGRARLPSQPRQPRRDAGLLHQRVAAARHRAERGRPPTRSRLHVDARVHPPRSQRQRRLRAAAGAEPALAHA